MSSPRPLALLGLPILLAGPARGDQLFFDRDAFLDAIAGDVVVDFEAEPVGPVIGDPWAALGVVFNEAGVGDGMEIGTGGGVDQNIFANSGPAADIEIGLTGTFHAFGLAVFSNDLAVAGEQIVFRGAGDVVLMAVDMPSTSFAGSSFVGYLANEPILRVDFIEDDGPDYAGIGDVAFGAQSLTGLQLSPPVPGLAGATSTLLVQGATPRQRIVFVVGTAPGATPAACAGLFLDLAQPQWIGAAAAAADGTAAVTAAVPPSFAGTTVLLQAVDAAGCAVSNSLTHAF
jgi:hypothetical protein